MIWSIFNHMVQLFLYTFHIKITVGSLSHKKQQWRSSKFLTKIKWSIFRQFVNQFFTKLTTIFNFSTPRCRMYLDNQFVTQINGSIMCQNIPPFGSLSHKKQQWWSSIPHKDYMINFSPICLINQFLTKLTPVFQHHAVVSRQSICNKSTDQLCAKKCPLLDHFLIKNSNDDHQFFTNIDKFLAKFSDQSILHKTDNNFQFFNIMLPRI